MGNLLNKIKVIFLIIILLCSSFPRGVYAEGETYEYKVSVSPSPVAIGNEVTLTVSLTDYTEEKTAIRGFQIDITNVDGILENANCTSLVTDAENVLSNTVSYQSTRDIVRQLYVKMSGTMAYGETELLRIAFKIPNTYTEAGVLALPMKFMIQNEAGDQITYESTIAISYAPEDEIPDQPDELISVDIEWDAMNFTYTDGVWNPTTYNYSGAGWTSDSNTVTVKNKGDTEVIASVSYENMDGYNFTGNWDTESETILADSEQSFTLTLEGKPETNFESQTIGTVTVTIGGE